MELKDVLAKITKGETLTDEEKTFVSTYAAPDIQGEVDKRANAIKAEAERKANEKIKTLEVQITELNQKLEEKDSAGLSEVEKMKKELERNLNALETLKKEKDELAKNNTSLQRNHAIDGLFGKLSFVKGANVSGMKTLFSHSLSDTDLNDEGAVKRAIDAFNEENKFALSATSSGGAGTQHGSGGSATNETDPMKQTVEERMKALQDSSKVYY